MKRCINITLFAMSEKGFAVLRCLQAAFPGIVQTVVASRDKNVEADFYTQIQAFCAGKGIAFYDRTHTFSVTTPVTIAVSWRWLISCDTSRLIVFHDSILPRCRGFNPLVTALIHGDTKIGVTALYGSDDYDRGEIISQAIIDVEYPITIREAITSILGCYEQLAQHIGQSLHQGEHPSSHPQIELQATYSLWRDEEDYFLDWSRSACELKRTIDALGWPYRGASSLCEGRIVRILEANEVDDVVIENRAAGKVIFLHNGHPIVVCGSGLLRIDALQDDSGASMLPLKRFRIRFM